MPVYEFECKDCGYVTELLIAINEIELVVCGSCGGKNLNKLISTPSSLKITKSFPGDSADRCCGSDGPPTSCAGPGSCCGRS